MSTLITLKVLLLLHLTELTLMALPARVP
jgi:hypothetical protein